MNQKRKTLLSLVLSFLLVLSITPVFVKAMSSGPVEQEQPEQSIETEQADSSGLVAHYTFNQELTDQTGNFEEGKVVGNRINEEDGALISYGEGKRDQAAIFDGKSGIRLPDGLISSNVYSVALWVNPAKITQFTTTFFGAQAKDQWISIVPNGPIGETMLWSGEDWYDAPTGLKIPTDQWSHLTITVNQGEVKVYLNGQERFSDSGFPDVFTNQKAKFALGVNYWDAPFKGKLDDLRVYNTAIKAERVKKLAKGASKIKEPVENKTRVKLDQNSVAVHDPMIIKDKGTYYVFGSHLGAAKSDDLIHWKSISNGFTVDNPIIPNPEQELKEALEWPEPDAESTWAKSPIKLNGKYYLYFSSSTWGAIRSAIGLAIAKNIEGPYEYQGLVIKSYKKGQENLEGVSHNPNVHPNAIDPQVFFDDQGKLWMTYGSYAGGIHILEMNSQTGKPYPNQGYGKRILGGNEAPIEGSYIQYNPKTEYYYLFASFGTLAADGGYNIRVFRSKNPDGPYTDPQGHNSDYQGTNELDFVKNNIDGHNWENVEPYGAKLIGNFLFQESKLGYLSPGHNSAIYDEVKDKMFIVFHSRFPGQGGRHQVRVHQMLMNSRGWPVITPHVYRGETARKYSTEQVVGTYQYVNHGHDIQATFGNPGGDINLSKQIELNADGSITGTVEGSWKMTGDYRVDITIDGETYHGAFLRQWDRGLKKNVMTFSALSKQGVTIWGSEIPE
ncbi:beta-xylosidase [Halobacteroides halobius DSM 5150]|uniref:Beta-xylosidase n=1 Tax=Halobacteroides halobius (strain ATCC 35273 / DSM 5150 / MD-1) TaxID=748449 RepID=L0KAU3_HALHC|nr:glycoside hydrolase family 43 C-terminal domain-containing protein [Halobacteroides halobius]AGB41660.1 beta-xylosidase [Halobacteroides halobius DSM 5150]